jgi:hypothetical protein
MSDRDDRFMQPLDAIEVLYDPRLQRARERVINGEDVDAVAAELAFEDVAAAMNAEDKDVHKEEGAE